MKNKFVIATIIILVIGFGIFLIKDSKISGNSVGDSENIQKVTLSIKGGNYYPQIINVNVNEIVRIYLDNSVSGCYRTFTIRDLGISKYIKDLTDYVEFIPTKKGTFTFACSMGMGTGKLIIE